MNSILNSLHDYYARERETLKTEPAVRDELRGLGIVTVRAEYDGVGDSGQIDQTQYLGKSAQPIEISEDVSQRVESLLYALLELRHGGWENNDGAYGTFFWDVIDGRLEHEHNARYTSHDSSTYEGFGVDGGDVS